MGPAPIHSLRSLFARVPLSHPCLDSNIIDTPHIMSNTMDNTIQLAVDGANWATYRDRLQFALEARGWSDHLTHENISRTYTDAGTINSQSPAIRWRMHEAAIMQIISTSIPDSVFNRIKSAANVKSLWEELIRLMEERSKIYAIDLDRRLHATRCGHEDNVRDHLQNLADMRECLAAAGKDIDDNQFASLMLNSLPPSYHSTSSSIIAAAEIGGKILSPQIVARLITNEYQRRAAEDHRREEQSQKKRRREEVRHHHKRKRQEPRDHREGSDDQEADEPNDGHRAMSITGIWLAIDADEDVASLHTPFTKISLAPTVADGPRDRLENADNAIAEVLSGEGISGSGSPTQERANHVEQDTLVGSADESLSCSPHKDQYSAQDNIYPKDDNDHDDLVCWEVTNHSIALGSSSQVETHTSYLPKIEVYDSGTTHHLSPYRQRFLDFKNFPPHSAACAGGDNLSITGIGDLRTEILNGASETSILLDNVLYAPNLNFTIVSMPRLAAEGYKILFENDLCKIVNQNGETVGRIPVNAKHLFRVEHERVSTRINRPATPAQSCG
jgi:hypothetical protein